MMNEYTCNQCHRVHTRSKKCIYCGAGARHQKPTIPVSTETPITPNPSPAPRVRIVATQLELSITPAALLQAEAAEVTT